MMALDLHHGQVVSTPDLCEWNDGEPVIIAHAHNSSPGRMTVLFQDHRQRWGSRAVECSAGMHLELVSGGCRRGDR